MHLTEVLFLRKVLVERKVKGLGGGDRSDP